MRNERSGDGWPPVGSRAEFSINNGRYHPAVLKYISNKFCILQYDSGTKGERCYTRDHHIDARPARTKEEKAVEEMAEIVGYPGSSLVIQNCQKLYNAGYRKQPTEKQTPSDCELECGAYGAYCKCKVEALKAYVERERAL